MVDWLESSCDHNGKVGICFQTVGANWKKTIFISFSSPGSSELDGNRSHEGKAKRHIHEILSPIVFRQWKNIHDEAKMIFCDMFIIIIIIIIIII